MPVYLCILCTSSVRQFLSTLMNSLIQGKTQQPLNSPWWNLWYGSWHLRTSFPGLLKSILTCYCLLPLQIATNEINQSIVLQGMSLWFLIILYNTSYLENIWRQFKYPLSSCCIFESSVAFREASRGKYCSFLEQKFFMKLLTTWSFL